MVRMGKKPDWHGWRAQFWLRTWNQKDFFHYSSRKISSAAPILEVQYEAEQLFGMDWYDPTCYASEILDAKYGEVSTDDVVDQLTHK
jgi:hypothetical protein